MASGGYDPHSVSEEVRRRLERKLRELEEDSQTAVENPSPINVQQLSHSVQSGSVADLPPIENAGAQLMPVMEPLALVPQEQEIEWEYVDEDHDDMVLCGVCFSLLQDPQLLTCCGDQLICKACLSKAHDRNRVMNQPAICPFCRSEDFKVIPNADVQRIIQNLQVRCPHKKDGCQWVGTVQEGEQHVTVDCQYVLLNCPHNCGASKLQRRQFSKHVKTCPNKPLPCVFYQICCKELVPLSDMKMHTKNAINDHLLAVAKENAKMATECYGTMQSLDTSSEQVLQKKLDTVANLKKILGQNKSTVHSLTAKLNESKKKRDSLLKENSQVSTQSTQQLQGQSAGAFRLRKLALGLQAHLESVRTPVVEGYTPIPVTFTLDKYSEMKANDITWLSPPFYTHLGGYKMCLTIEFNSGLNGHFVAIYLHMMKGENDHLLVWPFPGAVVTVLILNQRNTLTNMVLKSHGHASHCFIIDGKAWANFCQRVNDVTYGPGRGNQEFISQSQVGRFIFNDTLQIKVHQIDFLPL